MTSWIKHPNAKALVAEADGAYGLTPTVTGAETLLLSQFVAADDHWRPELATPFTVLVDGQPFTIATNGHRLLALPGDKGFPKAEDAKRSGVPKMLTTLPNFTATIALADLRKFVHATTPETCTFCHGETRWECEECDGLGSFTCTCTKCEDEHESDCEECEGEGMVKCDHCTATTQYGKIQAVQIGECFFNRANVTPAVRHLSGEHAALHLSKNEAKGPLAATHLIGDGWHVLLMPLRIEKEWQNAPAFDFARASGSSDRE